MKLIYFQEKRSRLFKRLGLEDELEPVADDEEVRINSNAIQIHPAEVAAKKMEKKIHDQLEESHAKKHLRAAAFETALLVQGL